MANDLALSGLFAAAVMVVFFLLFWDRDRPTAEAKSTVSRNTANSAGIRAMIRVGIVGLGFMGWIHWLAYQKLRGVRVAAVSDRMRTG